MKYYFIGIKGSGMSALAQVLHDDGHLVRGSDNDQFLFTEAALVEKGIEIDSLGESLPHDVDLFIVGHSFLNHPLHRQIIDAQLPWMEYHHFLADYASRHHSIAVSGTHGKTTTVGMMEVALSPLLSLNFLRGDGVGRGGKSCPYFLFEACEYQKHFLVYHPASLIITNIDYDHVETYPSVEEYVRTFSEYVKNADEVYILDVDRPKIAHNHVITYGLTAAADYRGEILFQGPQGTSGRLNYRGGSIDLEIPYAGQHNFLHVLAVLAYVLEHHLDYQIALQGLVKFSGVKRRLTQMIRNDDVFIDDYAHHPREMAATIEAVRQMYPSHSVIVFFKPDRYSRLIAFQEDFKQVLQSVDKAYVLPLYEHTKVGYPDSRILVNGVDIFYLAHENDLHNETFSENPTVFVGMSSKSLTTWMKEIVTMRESKC